MRFKKNIIAEWGRYRFDTYVKHDSQTEKGLKDHSITPYSGRDSWIYFVQEGIVALIVQEAHRVDFYQSDDTYLASQEIPAVKEGRHAYLNVVCGVEGDRITMKFPIYWWYDNYPHCDGEYDRWDTKTVGYHVVTFRLSDHSVSVELDQPI